MEFETRTLAVIVVPKGHPTHSDYATKIEITDEGAGEFVELTQPGNERYGKIGIAIEYWPQLRTAIDSMLADCRKSAE